jgi:hypothetical protein
VQPVVQLQLITARPTINVPAHRVKRDRVSQPIVLKSLLVDDHNRAPAIVRARVEVRLQHNWMTSWEINRGVDRAAGSRDPATMRAWPIM